MSTVLRPPLVFPAVTILWKAIKSENASEWGQVSHMYNLLEKQDAPNASKQQHA
jgi:hypothetical protein